MAKRPRSILGSPLTLLATLLMVAASAIAAGAAAAQVPGPVIEGLPAAFVGENGETYLLAPDGSIRLLTAYPTRAAGPGGLALDPTGATVATTRPDGIRAEVILVSTGDGGVIAVPGTAERNCGAPAFHPDGVHLLAVCDAGQDASRPGLDLFHRDHGHVRTVLEGKTQGLDLRIGGALLSPDGRLILVREFLGDYAIRYWRLDLSTGRVEPFVVGPPDYSTHLEAFVADGRILATRCEYCGWLGPGGPPAPLRTDIVVISPAGAVEAVLHSVDGIASSPALSPDGDTLLYTTYAGNTPLLWRLAGSTGELRSLGAGSQATYPQVSAPGGVDSPTSATASGRIGPPGPSNVWTVILHGALGSRAEASALARAAAVDFPDPGLLFSTDYPNLQPGFWVVYAGRYDGEAAAGSVAQRARETGYSGAYPRWLGDQRQ
jgi:hypothetical protein